MSSKNDQTDVEQGGWARRLCALVSGRHMKRPDPDLAQDVGAAVAAILSTTPTPPTS
jgi:hypothetical protein